MQKRMALLFVALLIPYLTLAADGKLTAAELSQPIQWKPTGDALWDAFAQASFDRLAAHGIDPDTLVTQFEWGDSPTLLDEAVLKKMEPQFSSDSRYWELCVWSLDSRFWDESLAAENDSKQTAGVKDASELPQTQRHPWPYYAKIEPYLSHLRTLAEQGKASDGGLWILFEHDAARIFWEQNQDPETLQKGSAEGVHEAGFLEGMIDREHTATFASELSPERQAKLYELCHWLLSKSPDNSYFRQWTIGIDLDLGRSEDARTLLSQTGGSPLRSQYGFPLSAVVDELAPGGSLSWEKVQDLDFDMEAIKDQTDRVALDGLLAGMVLAKPLLFPPFPFGTQVANGTHYRDAAAANGDGELLNAMHRNYLRGIGDSVIVPHLVGVDGTLDSLDQLAALRMKHAGGEMTADQRWALSGVQTKVAGLRAEVASALSEIEQTPLGLDTGELGTDEMMDVATSSLYAYMRNFVLAARKAESMGELKDKLEDLQRFDYGANAWRPKREDLRRTARSNERSVGYGAEDMLRFDYAARTWRASKRRLTRIRRRTVYGIEDIRDELKAAVADQD